MTQQQKSAEVEMLLSPPYEIPTLAIYARICELLGRDIGFNAFFMLERKRESEQARPLFRLVVPEKPATVPPGQNPGTPAQPAASDPAASEWATVPTLKSYARTVAPTNHGIPTYIPPPPQPFPIRPEMAPQAEPPTKAPPPKASAEPPVPKESAPSVEPPVVSLIRKPAPKPPAK